MIRVSHSNSLSPASSVWNQVVECSIERKFVFVKADETRSALDTRTEIEISTQASATGKDGALEARIRTDEERPLAAKVLAHGLMDAVEDPRVELDRYIRQMGILPRPRSRIFPPTPKMCGTGRATLRSGIAWCAN